MRFSCRDTTEGVDEHEMVPPEVGVDKIDVAKNVEPEGLIRSRL